METDLIDEIVVFLLANKGPDKDGRGHPTRKRLRCGDLEDAILSAEGMGLAKGLKPYHFKDTMSVWKDDKYINEVIVKKVESLLGKYKDLVELITKTDRKEITRNFTDNGFKVCFNSVAFGVFNNSPFEIVSQYIKLKGLEKEYQDLKPYHFARSTRETYKDKNYDSEVIVKKIDQLLKEKECSLMQLMIEANQGDLSTPVIDTLNGKQVEVSMFHLVQKHTKFKLFKIYHEAKGLSYLLTEDCFSRNPITRKERILSKY